MSLEEFVSWWLSHDVLCYGLGVLFSAILGWGIPVLLLEILASQKFSHKWFINYGNKPRLESWNETMKKISWKDQLLGMFSV
jgi:hypothetical protein